MKRKYTLMSLLVTAGLALGSWMQAHAEGLCSWGTAACTTNTCGGQGSTTNKPDPGLDDTSASGAGGLKQPGGQNGHLWRWDTNTQDCTKKGGATCPKTSSDGCGPTE
jgi:hypothetical protein